MEAARKEADVIPLHVPVRTGTGVPNPIWDACEEVLGYPPRTKSEKALWNTMTSSLKEAEATPLQIRQVAEWYRRHWPGIDLTITALEKWFSHFLAKAQERDKKKAAAVICQECEMGGGRHVSGCSKSASLS